MSRAAAGGSSWDKALAAFATPSAWTMFFFGFASGLPFLLVAGTLAYWLREGGIELREITMIASAASDSGAAGCCWRWARFPSACWPWRRSLRSSFPCSSA